MKTLVAFGVQINMKTSLMEEKFRKLNIDDFVVEVIKGNQKRGESFSQFTFLNKV